MSLRLVSLLGPNIDEACVDLAAALRDSGVDVRFDRATPWSGRFESVTAGVADLVWLCGKLALDLWAEGELVAPPTAAPEFTQGTGALYSSVVIAGRPVAGLTELCDRSVVWAANEPASWSGHHALLEELRRRDLPAPEQFRWSGSHVESIRMVGSGLADCAAIDRSVWEWAEPTGLFVVDETRSWPSPPLCVTPGATARDPGLLDALLDAGALLRNVERLVPVAKDHLDPIAAVGSG